MKRIACALLLAVELGTLSVAQTARGEETLEAVRAEREKVLQQMVKQVELEVSAGQSRMEALAEAQIRLLTFRRETAEDLATRRKWQGEIVKVVSELHEVASKLAAEDRVTSKELLLVKERLLAEKQRLLEMK